RAGAVGREGGVHTPGRHGPAAGVSRARFAPGRDPTGPRIGRPTRPEERVGDRAFENAAAAYGPLTRRTVLLLALRARAVGSPAPGDQLQPACSRRSLRTGRPLRPLGDLAGCEVNGTERGVPHLRRVDCIVPQLGGADAVARKGR